MALTTADYYWVDTFKLLQKQTDREIDTFNAASQSTPVFVSSLVEPQRFLKDFAQSAKQRTQNDITTILQADSSLGVFSTLQEIVNAKTLSEDVLLRTFAKNALLPLLNLEDRMEQASLFQQELLTDSPPDSKLRPSLRCLLTYVKDIFEPSKRVTEEIVPFEDRRLIKVSPEEFVLDEVPRVELQKRLNRGEIAPRDEWIPSNDKNNKKVVTTAELRARLNFGDRLLAEAQTALAAEKLDEAQTLYTQGVHLLDQYKSNETAENCDLQEYLNRFRRNNAVVNLKLANYRQAIASCTEVLDDDAHDGKARFLRAKAHVAVGDLESAEKDFELLRTDGFATESHRKAGAEGLRQLLIDAKKDRAKVSAMFQGVASSIDFSEDRRVGRAHVETDSPIPPRMPQTNAKKPDTLLPMPVPAYVNLLEEMLRIYTDPSVASRFEAIRHQVDYDERKIILKLQSILPEMLMPAFVEHNVLPESNDYVKKKKEFDRIVGVFQTSSLVSDSERIVMRSLLKSIREALVGGEETYV